MAKKAKIQYRQQLAGVIDEVVDNAEYVIRMDSFTDGPAKTVRVVLRDDRGGQAHSPLYRVHLPEGDQRGNGLGLARGQHKAADLYAAAHARALADMTEPME